MYIITLKMGYVILIVSILLFSCTTRPPEYELLGVLKDDRGRIIKKAESGWIPGEDIWLRITRYDTIGNVIEEYGAKPYGSKYKTTFKYDSQNRVIEECVYSFISKDNEYGGFENYGDSPYELSDTLVGFQVTADQLEYKTTHLFNGKIETIRDRVYEVALDPVTKNVKSILSFDTLYVADTTKAEN
jgi:hypothetical protein